MTSITSNLSAVTDILANTYAPISAIYKDDPAKWTVDRLEESLWSKQVEIMKSVVENRRTAVKSCHGVGKSFTAARLITWWIDTHPIGEAFVVSTAPSNEQVEAVLWREINKAAAKAEPPLPGRLLIKEWKVGNELIGYGRKPADYNPTAFQGIHARYVLVVLDEACGIPEALWIAAGALITNEDSRILAIGNPDDPTSHFQKVCQPNSGWNVLQIRAHDSPNFTKEPISSYMKKMLVSQAYLDDLKGDGCGPGTPIWTAKVEGEFPEDTEDSVVRASAVTKCRAKEQIHDLLSPVELGVDVGAGGDMSVIILRRGPVAIHWRRDKTPDTMKLVGYILDAIDSTGATRVKVDKTGVGQGVVDRLNEHRATGRITCEVMGVMTGMASSKPQRFPRLRDQIWWEIGRMLSENNEWDLSQLDDSVVNQLTAPRYKPDSSGRIKVEQKSETKKRLGRSPDDADALLLAFFNGTSSGFKEWMEELNPICAECGQPNPAVAITCSQCGRQLRDPSEIPGAAPERFSLTSGLSQGYRPPDPTTKNVMDMLSQINPSSPFSRWR